MCFGPSTFWAVTLHTGLAAGSAVLSSVMFQGSR